MGWWTEQTFPHLPMVSAATQFLFLNMYLFVIFLFIWERKVKTEGDVILFGLLKFTLWGAHNLFFNFQVAYIRNLDVTDSKMHSPYDNWKSPSGGPIHCYMLNVSRFVYVWTAQQSCLYPIIDNMPCEIF